MSSYQRADGTGQPWALSESGDLGRVGAQNGRTRLPTAFPSSPCAHHDPCPGTLYRYTLLLYGTAEDMTARPSGPQVTSSACVQRDTEGPCQGECPGPHGPPAGRRQAGSVRVRPGAGGGQAGAAGHGSHSPVDVSRPRAECQSPAYILGHLCLAYCPPRYFNHTQQAVTAEPGRPAAPALRVCSSCHSSCYTCRGSSPLDCTACPPPSMLDTQRGSCSEPDPPEGPPQPTATACPCRRGPAQAVVLALLAVAFGSPLLCRVLLVGCLPPWVGPPGAGDHSRHHSRPRCKLEPGAS